MPPTHAHPLTLPARWPFDVRRSPFFYGWVIWGLSTLGFLMSVPGQTMGMAVFTDPLIEALGLTRTQLSVAYFFGTVGSSLFLTRGGRWFDRVGARTMVVGSSVALALTLVFISLIGLVADSAAAVTGLSVVWFSFPLILLGYFGVRFSGQGLLTSASRNVLVLWFEKRRGLVSGMRGIFVSLGFSLAPLLLAWMIDLLSWQGALLAMAVVVGVFFAGLALMLLRDTPESCGLLPDGRPQTAEEAAAAAAEVHLTREQAIRTPVFWVYAMALSLHALFVTAVVFHIVSVFDEAGRPREQALAYFFPAAIVNTVVNLLVSWLADKHRLKPFLIAMLLSFLLGTVGLMYLDFGWGFWLMVFGLGAGGGIWGMLSNLAFVRLYGRRHLGEITGLNTSVTVFASAVGPMLFAFGLDWFGSYEPAYWLCGLFVLALLVAAVLLPQTEPAQSPDAT